MDIGIFTWNQTPKWSLLTFILPSLLLEFIINYVFGRLTFLKISFRLKPFFFLQIKHIYLKNIINDFVKNID